MKKKVIFMSCMILFGFCMITKNASAQDTLSWRGYLLNDIRLNVGDNFDFADPYFSREESQAAYSRF